MEQEPRERGKGAEAGMLPGVLLCYPKTFSLFQELTNCKHWSWADMDWSPDFATE